MGVGAQNGCKVVQVALVLDWRTRTINFHLSRQIEKFAHWIERRASWLPSQTIQNGHCSDTHPDLHTLTRQLTMALFEA
jgi:hypothetical protein